MKWFELIYNVTPKIPVSSSQVVEEALGVREGRGAVEGRARRGGEGHGLGAAHAAVVAAQGQPVRAQHSLSGQDYFPTTIPLDFFQMV